MAPSHIKTQAWPTQPFLTYRVIHFFQCSSRVMTEGEVSLDVTCKLFFALQLYLG